MPQVFFRDFLLILKVTVLLSIVVLSLLESHRVQGWQSGGTVTTVSAASYDIKMPVAPESIVAAFGNKLATRVEVATAVPLPTQLAGTKVTVNGQLAPLFFVSPGQINYLVPKDTPLGDASIVVTAEDGSVSRGVTKVASVSPALFSGNASGQGIAAATLLRVKTSGTFTYEQISRYDLAQGQFVPIPIDPGDPTDKLFISLYGTGLRGRPDLSSVTARIGGVSSEVLYAGETPSFVGLDQVNLRIPSGLEGRGLVDAVVSIAGMGSSNTVSFEMGSLSTANLPPVLTVPAAQTVVAGQSLSFTVSASDPDSGQSLTITAGSLPTGASFSQNTATGGLLTWTPTAVQIGSYTVSFTARDNGTPAASSSGTVVITVRLSTSFTLMDFTTAMVSESGVITRFVGTPVQRYFEDLGGRVSLEMVLIPGGSFTMGAPASEAGERADLEGPQRLVSVSSFVIGKFEVTQAQWRAVMGTDPSLYKGDNLPVERVSWDDAQEFCRRLNERLGLSGSTGYRLPSEAEWEYAARAGTTTPFTFGPTINADIVNYAGPQPYGQAPVAAWRQKTVNVGSLGVANRWGLYDMHGNVWEWCEDDMHMDYAGAPSDGRPWVDSPRAGIRVFRGGSWDYEAVSCRSAYRNGFVPRSRTRSLGFRISRTLP